MSPALPAWSRRFTTTGPLDALPPDAPRRAELIDGVLTTRPPRSAFHMFAARLFERSLRPPAHLAVIRSMTVALGPRLLLSPDVLVAGRPAIGPATTSFRPDQVHLVCEVVPAGARERDRRSRYAEAGIEHYWRVACEDDQPVVHAFRLGRDAGAYVSAGVHRGRLRLDAGFDVDIDLGLEWPLA
ncbi:Uma2 family endonuclease [Nonomuraea sp. NPDC049637]|uniref:Uma2 family endonuclease n=1 Tax=Nonomuraea sp. NPDC049637 TaxID=3154356 RepID=UPI00342F1E79